MSASRSDHFVNQAYLARFAAPDLPVPRSVYVYRRGEGAPRPSAIKNIACQPDYYRADPVPDGRLHPDQFDRFCQWTESDAGVAIPRVLSRRGLRDPEDRAMLVGFLGLLLVRVPRYRRWLEEEHSKAMHGLFRSEWSDDNKLREFLAGSSAFSEFAALPIHEARAGVLQAIRGFRLVAPRNFGLGQLLAGWASSAEHMHLMGWRLLLAAPDLRFVTSDAPVVPVGSDQSRGPYHLSEPGVRVHVALTAEAALLGGWGLSHRCERLTDDETRAYNRVIARACEAEVYASMMDKDVGEFVRGLPVAAPPLAPAVG